MAQSAGSAKNPLNIISFWEKASAEPPLEWSKWLALVELAVFAKDGIEIRNLLREKPEVTLPSEPILEVEIQGETDAQRRNRDVRNQEKNVNCENSYHKARDKGVMCNSVNWDEADARERSYLFLCLGMEGQRQVQQKRPGLNIQTTMTRQLIQVLEEIFITHRIIAFERYNFICRKQRKNETLEQLHADLVELASRADCGDRENEWVRDMFIAHMNNEKIAEELLAETRTQEAYEYAMRREKGLNIAKL